MENLRPRWLEVAQEQESEASELDFSEDLATQEALIALTEYPQWETFDVELSILQQEAIDRMLDPSIQSMSVIAAYRARARVLQWLRALPERSRKERDNLLEQQAVKEEDDGG